MSEGFENVYKFLETNLEIDLGKVVFRCGKVFNEFAPSSLGTILAFGFMGMSKSLKGKTEVGLGEVTEALENGVNYIMEKAHSKAGEKTILDAFVPAIEALKANSESLTVAFEKAAIAAGEGSESTKNMLSVHGRASYYGEKSLGVLDGGSVVGKLIFEAIDLYCKGPSIND